ncbi:hypothetical protein ACWC2K_32010 [Streptomyces chattanoogensis]|uniref:hypothetical protein n=1 Tax=Streptomyces chattanoogensis TaxID=66876 RepID=UPI00368AE9B4
MRQQSRRRAWWIILCAGLAGVTAALPAPVASAALSTGGAVATGTEAEHARQPAELGVPAPDLVLALPHRPEGAVQVVRAPAPRPGNWWAPSVRTSVARKLTAHPEKSEG